LLISVSPSQVVKMEVLDIFLCVCVCVCLLVLQNHQYFILILMQNFSIFEPQNEITQNILDIYTLAVD